MNCYSTCNRIYKKLNNVSFRKRLKSVVIKNNHIIRLNFNDSEIDIKEKDIVISALPLNSLVKFFLKIIILKNLILFLIYTSR